MLDDGDCLTTIEGLLLIRSCLISGTRPIQAYTGLGCPFIAFAVPIYKAYTIHYVSSCIMYYARDLSRFPALSLRAAVLLLLLLLLMLLLLLLLSAVPVFLIMCVCVLYFSGTATARTGILAYHSASASCMCAVRGQICELKRVHEVRVSVLQRTHRS